MIYLSKKYGFTLLEIIVVLLILSMAATMVTISMGRARDKAIVRDEARWILNTLRHARQLSLMERKPVEFKVDAEAGTYVLIKAGASMGQAHKIHSSLEIWSDPIVFYPKGNSTGGRVLLRGSQDRNYSIEVDNVTGLAKLQRL